MARNLNFPEKMLVRFSAGTIDRIERIIQKPEEDRTSFIRQAIERELKRRERPTPKSLTPR